MQDTRIIRQIRRKYLALRVELDERARRQWVAAELLRNGMIGAEDMNLFLITDDIQRAVDEIVTFYKRYHSARYAADLLVLRLNSPISDSLLERLNDPYSVILNGGKIEQFPGPIDGEQGDRPDKVRLALRFNRKNVGLLRLMINDINRLE